MYVVIYFPELPTYSICLSPNIFLEQFVFKRLQLMSIFQERDHITTHTKQDANLLFYLYVQILSVLISRWDD